jgi:hypothetical protein
MSDDEILDLQFRELDLHIEGTELAARIDELYRELEARTLVFRPHFWLSDEWFTPDGIAGVAIPFYLAHPRLAKLELAQMLEIEGGDPASCMRILRHEAGHAIDNAFHLRRRRARRDLFGRSSEPYPESYTPKPYSKNFVLHLDSWYAQSHPDEDFAETFAVWLTPGSGWRKRYRKWPAMRKLKYVEATVKRFSNEEPLRKRGLPDITVDDMDFTLEEFYRQQAERNATAVEVEMQADLPDIFLRHARRRKVRPAADLVTENRELITDKIEYWTGVARPVVRALVESIVRHCRELGLHAEVGKESRYLVELAAYGTTLAMNYLTRGKFEQA